MSIEVPIVWILGGPACGKGTQCAKISRKYQFTHLSTGDLLRDEVARGSSKGQEMAAIMREGRLVSDDDVLYLLEKAVRSKASSATGFIIDGYPRAKDQGLAFESKVSSVDLVLYLECLDETMVRRSRVRASVPVVTRFDDTDSAIQTRINIFRANTGAICRHYRNKLVTIDADRPPSLIFISITCAIDAMLHHRKRKLAPKPEAGCRRVSW